MSRIKTALQKGSQGFTIIEVMIVLAIAGLILGVVLVAIPQLQKNQRNESRKSVLARISAEVDNYIGNNEGVVPTNTNSLTTGFTTGFMERYITSASGRTFDKPGGGNYSYLDYSSPSAVEVDTIVYHAGGKCDGELPSGTGASATRNFAIAVGLEGGSSYCVDNE